MAYGRTIAITKGVRGALRGRENVQQWENEDAWRMHRAQQAIDEQARRQAAHELAMQRGRLGLGEEEEEAAFEREIGRPERRAVALAAAGARESVARMRPTKEAAATTALEQAKVNLLAARHRATEDVKTAKAADTKRTNDAWLWEQGLLTEGDIEQYNALYPGLNLEPGQRYRRDVVTKRLPLYAHDAETAQNLQDFYAEFVASGTAHIADPKTGKRRLKGPNDWTSPENARAHRLILQGHSVANAYDRIAKEDAATETGRHHKAMEDARRATAARGSTGRAGAGRTGTGRAGVGAVGGEFESGLQQLKAQGHKYTRVVVGEGVAELKSDKPQQLATAARRMGYTALVSGKAVVVRLRGKTTLVGGVEDAKAKYPVRAKHTVAAASQKVYSQALMTFRRIMTNADFRAAQQAKQATIGDAVEAVIEKHPEAGAVLRAVLMNYREPKTGHYLLDTADDPTVTQLVAKYGTSGNTGSW